MIRPYSNFFYCSRLLRRHPEHAAKIARLLDIEDRTRPRLEVGQAIVH